MGNGISGLPPAKAIMLKDRSSIVFLQYGRVDVESGAFVLADQKGIRTQIPVGSVSCIMLETGTTVTHEAVKLAARVGCLLLWVGDGGVRLYSAGQPGGTRADKLLYQAKCALDDQARLTIVREMYRLRFKERAPSRRSIDQLRGIEGSRVRQLYKSYAQQFGVEWKHRHYDPRAWTRADPVNKALSAATSSLYGLCEAAILAAGYSPAIGFIHTGKPRSFVFDIADIFKFDTVIPAAFKEIAKGPSGIEQRVRIACRNSFREGRLLKRIVPTIEMVLSAGGLERPTKPVESVGPAFEDPEGLGDDGHRY